MPPKPTDIAQVLPIFKGANVSNQGFLTIFGLILSHHAINREALGLQGGTKALNGSVNPLNNVCRPTGNGK